MADEREQISFIEEVDNYINVKPGEPYRLFPFKTLKRGKTRHEITPDTARNFRLPHYKPAIKLGSHNETTPAGGHIVALEVRSDGLYAIPEFNDEGVAAVAKGAYRYHSPEVIWEGGGIEDAITGEFIPGPLILGDALLHNPALGEAASLYSVETTPMGGEGEQIMENENIAVPKGIWDVFTAWFSKKVEKADELAPVEPVTPEPAPAQAAPEETEQYQAVVRELDEYKAKFETMEAERKQTERVEKYAAELRETKVEGGAEMLAAMSDEQADWVVQQFKALSSQVNESALLGEHGSDAEGDPDPKSALDKAAQAYMVEHKCSYVDAVFALRSAKPELFTVYSH